MTIDHYYTFGRTGLRVSRLCLGAMTFGNTDWGCDKETSRTIFDRYLELGGNFIDTANLYGGGESEKFLGDFITDAGNRENIVLATKFTFASQKGDPNASGNGRKSMIHSLERSLRRLKTDYVDILLMHVWDQITPVEEVMRSLDDVVRQGKVRHIAFSDVPAWYAARAQTIARFRGYEPICALQMSYSLAERGLEYEFPPMCLELGMGLMVWGPLASGMLSGKYKPNVDPDRQTEGRLKVSQVMARFSEKNWEIVAELEKVAKELGRPMSQVAINWVANRPAVGTVILGANNIPQLDENMGALDFEVPDELLESLDKVSKLPSCFPYSMISRVRPMTNLQASNKWPGYYGRI